MMALRKLLIASLSVAVLAGGAAQAASTSDFSDQWWVPSESGWGASVQQQASTLFIDLMVYAGDGKPAWFSAAAYQQANAPAGHTVFAGDLYATTGPSPSGAFDPALVNARKIGALTFDASSLNNAILSYTVDGTPVVKNVQRQTWSYENLTGNYDTMWKYGCGGAPAFPSEWGFTNTVIDHRADNAVTMDVAFWGFGYEPAFDVQGTYAQSGHMGEVEAVLIAPNAGSIRISEIEKTTTGFTARLAGEMSTQHMWQGAILIQSCQITEGRIVAVRRP
jgi:hypothetical protein